MKDLKLNELRGSVGNVRIVNLTFVTSFYKAKNRKKRSYLMSIIRNSNSTDKPKVQVPLILLPPHLSAPFYGYFRRLTMTVFIRVQEMYTINVQM